ncbi:unnamed protein product [Malassezia sympodialis ATCC 42132]|uniref:uncharacterized protein n=1 Tax=Malassezia sympodialis (strain ATCC 42132) TaxID=1230383 RepID=UPI0002C2212C|nr:uncharacterized protein MSY001_2041 [Malassezia sympodialis ATCC 42132]CCU99335.1 unnamed protein product [Malassezia sympodialis ATCC 42132]|eukprot:XP_018740589.1 uncharacterized protein MSY001_2041 [Malassezia sympodialis ATCC 42132]
MSSAPVIQYEVYRGEQDIEDVMRLIEKELSEPYHIYTYRYFLSTWYACLANDRPQLSLLAWKELENGKKEAVGVIVCKLDRHLRGSRLWRGYIAMLSVEPHCRGHGIGA